MSILICIILMVLIAGITYYLGKKVSNSFMKYIPVFSFAIGALFFYIKLSFISYKPGSFDNIYDKITIIIFVVVGSIALLEALIIDVVRNSSLFAKSYTALRKTLRQLNSRRRVRR